MLKIRTAKPEDTGIILGFIKELADFEKLSHQVTATETQLRKTLFEGERVAHVVIGEWNGKAVSFALYFFNFSTFLAKPGLYLEDLYVQPEFRSKGIGRQMLLHLVKIAAAKDCGRMEWSVLDWNERAIEFYEGLGAKPLSDWTMYRLTEDVIHQLSGASESRK